jgi:hypothetical protein
MDIDREVRNALHGFYDQWSDGNIGHKMTVHDIGMNPIRPGGFNLPDFISKHRKVS